MPLKVGQILTNEDLINLMGSEKQKNNYKLKRMLQPKTKKSLLKQLDRYCKYETGKKGKLITYKITEVFNETKEKVDNRKGNSGGSNNSIYQDDFINIMIYNLYNYPERCKLLSRSYLCKMANLVNSNYTTCKRNISELSIILDISEDEVYSFYNDNQKKLASIVERGLNNCRRKSILTYNSTTVVVKKELKLQYNDLGEPVVKNNKPVYDINHIHRIATENELEMILNIEHTVKEAMFGNKNTDNKNVFLSGRWSEYKSKIKNELKLRDLNIEYYYEAYELNWIKSNIEELYKEIVHKYDDSSNNINKNYINSVENTINNNSTKTRGVYKKENYANNQFKLSNTLIDKNTEYLGNDKELRMQAEFKRGEKK